MLICMYMYQHMHMYMYKYTDWYMRVFMCVSALKHACLYIYVQWNPRVDKYKKGPNPQTSSFLIPNPGAISPPLPLPDTNHSPSSRGQQLAPPRQLSTISLYSSRDRAGRKHPRRDTNAARYPHKAALATSLAAGVSYAPFTLLSIGTPAWVTTGRLAPLPPPWFTLDALRIRDTLFRARLTRINICLPPLFLLLFFA